MSRYILFQYDYYYPAGGMNDFVAVFNSVEEAKAYNSANEDDTYDVADIFDLLQFKILFRWQKRDGWVEMNMTPKRKSIGDSLNE